jgi:hypothetical protein
MNTKSFLFAFLFFVSLTSCFSPSEKTLNVVVTTVGLVLIADNFWTTLPKFFKEDKYKQLDRESGWMLAKGIGAGWYFIRWANFLKKTIDQKYIMGSLSNDSFKATVTELLEKVK